MGNQASSPEAPSVGRPTLTAITFQAVDPEAAPGAPGSPSRPLSVRLDDTPEAAKLQVVDASAIVIAKQEIRLCYSTPTGGHGPSEEEKVAGGWIYDERAPDGQSFTRADLVRIVQARMRQVFEAEKGQKDSLDLIPGRTTTTRIGQSSCRCTFVLALQSILKQSDSELYGVCVSWGLKVSAVIKEPAGASAGAS